jgi:hypothetical protein
MLKSANCFSVFLIFCLFVEFAYFIVVGDYGDFRVVVFIRSWLSPNTLEVFKRLQRIC